MFPFFQCLSLNLTDTAISIKNAVKHLSTSLNGVESRTRDRMRVLAQGRVIDRQGTEMRMHQQAMSHIVHARTRLRSMEARAQAIQWKQPHVMRELCSMDGLRNLTSYISVENAKLALARRLQNHRRSRSLPPSGSKGHWVCAQAVQPLQYPARSASLPPPSLCALQAVPARRATDPSPASRPPRPSAQPLYGNQLHPTAVPAQMPLGSTLPYPGLHDARQSRPTARAMPVAGPASAEPRQRSYALLLGAPTTDVVDALSVLVEFLEVAQLVWMLCTSPAGTVSPTAGAQGVRNGGL